jgi:NADPH:quinone reductase-like Zn-dependent oxidoreductase
VFVSGDTLGRIRDGTYAEYVIVPPALVLPMPKEMRYEDAAAIGVSALTAWQALVDRASLQAGQSVLIHAAGSGVGVAAIQIAKLLGARVIATAGSDAKLDRARQLGADLVINYARGDFVLQTRNMTGGRGVDVILDAVGGETFRRSLDCLSVGGRLVAVGMVGGAEVRMDLRQIVPRGISVLGLNANALPPYQAADRYRQLSDLVVRGRLSPVIDRILPLAEAATAHRILAQRQHFGKVLLKT